MDTLSSQILLRKNSSMNTTELQAIPSHNRNLSEASQRPSLMEPAKDTIPTRLPSLDGWRALSILIVLGEHTIHTKGFPEEKRELFSHLFDGHLGVRFFFVISGFLITWLMLTEERRFGTVSMKKFYARRALRILPVYFVFLSVLALLQFFTPFRQGFSAWFGNITFTRNCFFYDNFTSNHLWSLSVEEQFYLVWPACFIFVRPQASWKKCLGLLITMITLAAACRFAFNYWALSPIISVEKAQKALLGPWSFFNNADSLAIGCLLAMLLARERVRVSAFLGVRPLLVPACGLLLLLAPVLLHLQSLQSILTSVHPTVAHGCSLVNILTDRTLQSLGFAMLLLQSIVAPQFPIYRILNLRPVMHLGVLSYSIYIWQQLFCTWPENYGMTVSWWNSYPLWFVPALLVALLSYYALELPLLNLRHRFR